MDTIVIPFDPQPNDVVVVNPHDVSLKGVNLLPNGNNTYYRLLRSFKPQLSRQKEDPDACDRIADEIVETITVLRKGRFLRLVDAGPENKGLCTVMSAEETRDKVRRALCRMRFRVKNSDTSNKKQRQRVRKRSSLMAHKRVGSVAQKASRKTVTPTLTTGNASASGSNSDIESFDDEESKADCPPPTVMPKHSNQELIPFNPKFNDVIAAPYGGRHNDHPGNVAYKNLVAEHLKLHLEGGLKKTPNGSCTAAEAVVEIIWQRQGRFLKWEKHAPKVCRVMNRQECIFKVRNAFAGLVRNDNAFVTVTPNEPNKHLQASVGKPSKVKRRNKIGSKGPHRHEVTETISLSSTRELSDDENHNKKPRKMSTTPDCQDESKKLSKTTPDGPCNIGLDPSKLYGNREDEIRMRKWLNEHKLPQTVGDLLVKCGARDVDDILLLVETSPHQLREMAPLDLIKLKKAIEMQRRGRKAERDDLKAESERSYII